MLFRSVVCIAAFSLAACATSPQSGNISAGSYYKAPSLTNLSRIDIAQNYRFAERRLPEYAGVLAAASPELAQAHTDAAALPDRLGSRIQNIDGDENGTVIFHRAQQETPQGWDDNGEALVHRQSGLSCPHEINIESEGRQYTLEDITQFDTAGRQIACGLVSSAGGAVIAVFASYWPDITRDDHAVSTAASIYQRYNVSEQLPVPVVTLSPAEGETADPELFSGLEEAVAGGFAIEPKNGVPYKTSFWLAKTHDWHVKVQAVYPQEDVTSELIAAIYFSAAHLGVRAKNMAEPTAPGVDV